MKRRFTKYPSNYVGAASETSGAAMRRKKREDEQKGKEGIELLATDGDWELYTPKTWEGSVYLGRMGGVNAQWSTAYIGEPRYFELYNERGPLYVFINKATGEKYQSHPATRSWFYDVNDRNLGKEALDNFICEHPAFAEFFDVQCDEDIEGCGDINACGDTKYAADMSNCINCSDDFDDEGWLPEDITEDELIDILAGYEWDVLDELGLDLEQNTQGSMGSIEIFPKGDYKNAININYMDWLNMEERFAYSSASSEEFKAKFKGWIKQYI